MPPSSAPAQPDLMERQEKVISGLLGMVKASKFGVDRIEGKGCGLVLEEPVKKGSFFVEYYVTVYPRREQAAREREYSSNGEGCYIIDVQTPDG